jgi:two-component system nitrate/nitrite sensor histidine kinase NarX
MIASQLIYIVQEAVQNAIKHGTANRVSITLKKSGQRVHLSIVDNGKGFVNGVKSKGMGLEIMRFRAKTVGADFKIESRSTGGTCVEISFPGCPNAEGVC